MLKTKLLISLVLILTISVTQVSTVFAAPALQSPGPIDGSVQQITLETDIYTGITTVLVTVSERNDLLQTVRVNLEAAIALGLVILNADGNPVINDSALGQPVEIDSTTAITGEEIDHHPVGNALAYFFSDLTGVNYDIIMAAHEEGIGFGVIAQALWLTKKLEGDSGVFLKILEAKQSGDYSSFTLEDGTAPENWGQLKKAILDGDKIHGLGVAISNNDNGNGNDNGIGNGLGKDKDKDKEKNNGKGKNK